MCARVVGAGSPWWALVCESVGNSNRLAPVHAPTAVLSNHVAAGDALQIQLLWQHLLLAEVHLMLHCCMQLVPAPLAPCC